MSDRRKEWVCTIQDAAKDFRLAAREYGAGPVFIEQWNRWLRALCLILLRCLTVPRSRESPSQAERRNSNGNKEDITVRKIHVQNSGCHCGSRNHESHCRGPESADPRTATLPMQSKC